MKKAVFFDRDGTIIEERGYLSNVGEIKILDGVVEGLRLLKENGFLLIVVSNQSGIARGYFDLETVHKVHARLNELLLMKGVMFDKIYFCPHYPGGIIPKYSVDCECRKPRIKMALDAGLEFNIALNKSYMVGDKCSDIEFGRSFGATAVVQVDTGYNNADLGAVQPDFLAPNLFKAAEWITSFDLQAKSHE